MHRELLLASLCFSLPFLFQVRHLIRMDLSALLGFHWRRRSGYHFKLASLCIKIGIFKNSKLNMISYFSLEFAKLIIRHHYIIPNIQFEDSIVCQLSLLTQNHMPDTHLHPKKTLFRHKKHLL